MFMKIYRFDQAVGQPISRFGSRFVMSLILRTTGRRSAEASPEEAAAEPLTPGTWIPRHGVQIGCMHLGVDGLVGYHQAVVPQLFLVVAGEGWVCDATQTRTPVRAGLAACWEAGEWHAAGSATGMTAIVVEGEGVDPAPFLPEA